ncbi:hypothetical protein [Halobaculum sp. D14]|uniref:hypothetical protein n=1 Tax=Halobaculum sp. D14 TaxID=3421642 RepID=UPI003EBD4704
MPSTATRLQLFGIALVLAGGLRDLVVAASGSIIDPHSVNVGAVAVGLGLLFALVGLVAPAVRRE